VASASAWAPWVAGFTERLRDLGCIEGRTVTIQYRWAEGRSERFAEIAAELIQLKVDAIVTAGAAVLAAKQATTVILSFSRWPLTRLAPDWSQVWRAQTAMSLACRFRQPILLASGSSSYASLSRVSGPWRSWPYAGYAAAVREMGEVRAAARSLGLETNRTAVCNGPTASELRRRCA
jgi:precorrin-6x reductase